jgi:hypothetical protein
MHQASILNLVKMVNLTSHRTTKRSNKGGNDCYRWCGGDEVNDRPVGKPQEEGMMNIAASFFLSKKPRFVGPVGKGQTQEGDAF